MSAFGGNFAQLGRRDPLQGLQGPEGASDLADQGFTITTEDVADTVLDFVPIVGGAKDIYKGIRDGDGWQVAIGAGSIILDIFTAGGASVVKGGIKTGIKAGGRYLAKNSAKKISSKGERAYRLVTEGEINAIKKTGLLRGGRPGENFFTKDLYKSGMKAKDRLSLPTKPTHRVEFEILNNPELMKRGSKVTPANGGRGGGSEWLTLDPVEVKIINVQPLR